MSILVDEDTIIEILSRHLGSIIDHIIEKNRFPIDLEYDYEDVLLYIYRRLVKIWFKNIEPTEEALEERIKQVKRRKRVELEVLLSYLISRYVHYRRALTVSKGKE